MVFAPPLSYPNNRIGQAIFGSQEGLLLFQSLCFSTYALVAAVCTMAHTRQTLDRDSLRGPFSTQSYLAAPFAVLVSLSFLLLTGKEYWARPVGSALIVASILWYIGARAIVYRHLTGTGLLWSLAIVGVNFLVTTILIIVATFLLLQVGQ